MQIAGSPSLRGKPIRFGEKYIEQIITHIYEEHPKERDFVRADFRLTGDDQENSPLGKDIPVFSLYAYDYKESYGANFLIHCTSPRGKSLYFYPKEMPLDIQQRIKSFLDTQLDDKRQEVTLYYEDSASKKHYEAMSVELQRKMKGFLTKEIMDSGKIFNEVNIQRVEDVEKAPIAIGKLIDWLA